MKALIISPRFPWPAYTGDRLRATVWLTALARNAEVTLVAPSGDVPKNAPPFRFCAAKRSMRRAAHGVIRVMRDGLPAQCLLAAPYDWADAIARAGAADVTIVLLSRTHPWVRSSIGGRTVLDAVDSLSRNADERARASSLATRWLWRIEQRRMARLELDAARTYDRVVILSDDERACFGDADAVSMGIAATPRSTDARTFDFGFWGRLPYFANADAVNWLLDEIWPAIRALHPNATMIIGGADANRSLRNDARRRGVTLVSPIDDVATFARHIRVALMPLRYGSGQSNKILEAAEAGCAIVGTPQALRGFGQLASLARIESTSNGLARAAVDLLSDETAGEKLRGVVETVYARSITLDRLSTIAEGVTA